MPTYELICPSCRDRVEAVLSMAEFDAFKARCRDCKVVYEREFRSSPAIIIPQHMQSAPNMAKKELASVPINIIDDKGDGSYRVTRIGKKGDIEGD